MLNGFLAFLLQVRRNPALEQWTLQDAARSVSSCEVSEQLPGQ